MSSEKISTQFAQLNHEQSELIFQLPTNEHHLKQYKELFKFNEAFFAFEVFNADQSEVREGKLATLLAYTEASLVVPYGSISGS